uniref:6-phosphofructo-2-kinase domain-containing protein n=1 Tax=Paramoeba aestuarina TaxID=180227 RepID=A0A7S4N7Y3_9EUKA|mmetsp:Transcript_12188/g.18600  ORF Transcript_12188/g.18600 Transcript_12188/m.18600 type:complete len:578 (+) Transcript_12188:242-1975(+)
MTIRWVGDKQAKEVTVCASFGEWKPMKMVWRTDAWELEDELFPPTGTHTLFFLVDGVRKVDPTAPTVKLDNNKEYNTYCTEPNTVHSSPTVTYLSVPPREHQHHHHHNNHKRAKSHDWASMYHRAFLNQFMIPGVSKHCPLPEDTTTNLSDYRKLVLIMVGLPARGKSFTSRKLCRYLNWAGLECKVFNYGEYRRENLSGFQDSKFFSSNNPDGVKLRDQFARMAMEDCIKFLKEGGGVAILDGTNSTVARRQMVVDFLKGRKELSLKAVFIEVICNDQSVIRENVINAKLSNPDYATIADKEKVLKDFMERVHEYEKTYEPLGTQREDKSYIKIIDVNRQLAINRCYGYVMSKIISYVSNLHSLPRPIYLCRHGQSEYNLDERLGGDPPITEKGLQYAINLNRFFEAEGIKQDMAVFSSTMTRSVQTAVRIGKGAAQYVKWKALDEIDVGICDGMTYDEVKESMPEEFAARSKDKLRYRYPRGESYVDLAKRLEPVIMEIERNMRPTLIVGHQAVLRCLLAYLNNVEQEKMPHITLPLNTVLKLTPHAYGTKVDEFKIPDYEVEKKTSPLRVTQSE